MNHVKTGETSEAVLMSEFYKLSDAGGSIIQIRTREVTRAASTMRRALLAESDTYMHNEWDAVHGWRNFTSENCTNSLLAGQQTDFFAALERPLTELREATSNIHAHSDKIHCFVYSDPDPFIKDNPIVIALLQQYATILPAKNVCIVLITPMVDLSYLPLGTVLVTDMPTPSVEELSRSLSSILNNLVEDDKSKPKSERGWREDPHVTEEDIERIATLGLGMTRSEFETHVSIAIVKASTDREDFITTEMLLAGVTEGKTEVVKQSDILELFPSEDISNVAGMQRLKDWISDRKVCFSQEARDAGIEPLKGLAIVGVPGCGKSLIAKAVGGVLGFPVIRLDFGRVFSKFIGDSESRLRSALSMIERMDRLVLFCDEIDKGLGGVGGGSDGGVSSRVLGTFLTWMQENKSDALVIMTANRIEGLPPELFRRGRLDAVFSVGLPSSAERREVLKVHMRRRGKLAEFEQFDKADFRKFEAASDKFIPAEIEAAVKDSLIAAFNKGETLDMSHILEELSKIVPLSTSHAADIEKVTEWARNNAMSVTYPEDQQAELTAGTEATRRLPRRNARNVH